MLLKLREIKYITKLEEKTTAQDRVIMQSENLISPSQIF